MRDYPVRRAMRMKGPFYFQRKDGLEQVIGIRRWAKDYMVTTENGDWVVSGDRFVHKLSSSERSKLK